MQVPTSTRHTFIEFANRDGISRANAAYEFDNFLTANGRAILKDFYLYTHRLGAPMTLNRAERAAIYRTFENAQAHAWFAVEAA